MIVYNYRGTYKIYVRMYMYVCVLEAPFVHVRCVHALTAVHWAPVHDTCNTYMQLNLDVTDCNPSLLPVHMLANIVAPPISSVKMKV